VKTHLVDFIERVDGAAPENVYRSVRTAVAAFEARPQASSDEAADRPPTDEAEPST
jgi:hypothetical protein